MTRASLTADGLLPGSARQAARERAFAVALALAPLVAAVLFLRPSLQGGWVAAHYLPVHTVVETLVIVVAFATFAVQWYAAGAQLSDARARFIGSAFLSVALLETAHLLSFPGMPGLVWLESSTERGIVYWLAARIWTIGALLAALAIRPDSRARWLRRAPLLATALGGVAAVLLADAFWISRAPRFYVEGEGLTTLKRLLELLVAGGALAGMLLYRRRYREQGDRADADLTVALGLTVVSELCFTLYARAYDGWNLLGHVYLLLASYAAFHALFAGAVIRPYARLAAVSEALGASNAELRRLQERIEGELEVTIRDLRTLQDQREDLLRAVSHDLRTPLQVVVLQAGRLARTAATGSAERRATDAIAAATRQMDAMIRDLVDAVHLESGTVKLKREPVAVRPFVADLVAVTSGALETGRVRLELPADLPAALADPARLARVLQNLVGNALKYSEPGTEVVIRGEASDGRVVVAVADRGAGIAPEHRARIFERFCRGARDGQGDGLGLGLYISRLIVEAHGGRISCESAVGVGSTFTFDLPAA